MHSKPHFITFTGNALAESTFELETWREGATQRASKETFQTGGKGINVSKMLQRLGCPTTTLTFLDGDSGRRCSTWLRDNGFQLVEVPTGAPTRSGLVIRAPQHKETTFLGPDVTPSPQAWQNMATALGNALNTNALPIFAFCGSCPGWSAPEADPFKQVLTQALAKNLPVCADTYGAPLDWLLRQPLDLVRINADELHAAHQKPLELQEKLVALAASSPVKTWIVSDGPRKVWLLDDSGDLQDFQPPSVQEVSATGSGDVLMAALLKFRYADRLNWAAALALALPLAAANAAHPGIADFPLPHSLPHV